MGIWVELYTALRTKLVRERGQGAVGTTGAPLPRMHGADAFAMLALVYEDLLEALKRANAGTMVALRGLNLDRYVAINESIFHGQYNPALDYPERIELARWVTHGRKMASDAPLARDVLVGESGRRFPYYLEPGSANQEQPYEVGNLMDRWDRCIRLAGLALVNILRPEMSAVETVEFWKSYYNLILALEVMIETPRASAWDRVKGAAAFAAIKSGEALQDATEAAAELAGRAAAEIAETAGKAAGAAAKGFFDQAGMTAILAVGVAIYIAMN